MKRKIINDYENYTISEDGKVFSLITNKKLSARCNKQGYEYVNLYNENGKKSHKIHRLVATYFVPNPNNYNQVNHLDGCKTNNRKNNLIWCSASENMQHAYEKGLINLNTQAHREAAVRNGKEYRSRKVKLIDLKTREERVFYSATQCEEEMKFPKMIVSNYARRGHTYIGRYRFEYLINTLATTMGEDSQ